MRGRTGSERTLKAKNREKFPYAPNATGMLTYLWLKFMVNVGKYFIRGVYGNDCRWLGHGCVSAGMVGCFFIYVIMYII